MKKIAFILGVIVPSLSHGADWVYVTSGDKESFYIDKSYYNFDSKSNTVEVWERSTKPKFENKNQEYTFSKSLAVYSCANKRVKQVAGVKYTETGSVLSSSSTPKAQFEIIFPETIGESLWKVACQTKGKGLKFPKYEPEFVDLKSADVPSLEIIQKIKNSKEIPNLKNFESLAEWQDAILNFYNVEFPESSINIALFGYIPKLSDYNNLYYWVYAIQKYGEKIHGTVSK